MVTLRCGCPHYTAAEITEAARFRLVGMQLFNEEGKQVATLQASSVQWERHNDTCDVLEIQSREPEKGIALVLCDATRLGPFDKVTVSSGGVRAGNDFLAQFHGDKRAWCTANLQQPCDPILFQAVEQAG